jgi:hypothetical protein
MIFKTGEDALEEEVNGKARKGRGREFSEALWGRKTCNLITSINRLPADRWPKIKADCSAYLRASESDDDEYSEDYSDDDSPHANVDVNW